MQAARPNHKRHVVGSRGRWGRLASKPNTVWYAPRRSEKCTCRGEALGLRGRCQWLPLPLSIVSLSLSSGPVRCTSYSCSSGEGSREMILAGFPGSLHATCWVWYSVAQPGLAGVAWPSLEGSGWVVPAPAVENCAWEGFLIVLWRGRGCSRWTVTLDDAAVPGERGHERRVRRDTCLRLTVLASG